MEQKTYLSLVKTVIQVTTQAFKTKLNSLDFCLSKGVTKSLIDLVQETEKQALENCSTILQSYYKHGLVQPKNLIEDLQQKLDQEGQNRDLQGILASKTIDVQKQDPWYSAKTNGLENLKVPNQAQGRYKDSSNGSKTTEPKQSCDKSENLKHKHKEKDQLSIIDQEDDISLNNISKASYQNKRERAQSFDQFQNLAQSYSITSSNSQNLSNSNSNQDEQGRIECQKITFANGTTYEGQWLAHQRDGYGVETFLDGQRYEGQYEDDEFHGKGKLFYTDGRCYEGMFKKGIRHGYGEERDVNGKITSGNWINGKKHGEFKVTEPSEGAYRKTQTRDDPQSQPSTPQLRPRRMSMTQKFTAFGSNINRDQVKSITTTWEHGIFVSKQETPRTSYF